MFRWTMFSKGTRVLDAAACLDVFSQSGFETEITEKQTRDSIQQIERYELRNDLSLQWVAPLREI